MSGSRPSAAGGRSGKFDLAMSRTGDSIGKIEFTRPDPYSRLLPGFAVCILHYTHRSKNMLKH